MLDKINSVFVNAEDNFRPLQNIRIRHTMVIDDPFEGKETEFSFNLACPSRSPSPVQQTKTLKDFVKNDHVYLEDDIDLQTMKG